MDDTFFPSPIQFVLYILWLNKIAADFKAAIFLYLLWNKKNKQNLQLTF